ncbi:hypothetical protein [Thiomonas sp.]
MTFEPVTPIHLAKSADAKITIPAERVGTPNPSTDVRLLARKLLDLARSKTASLWSVFFRRCPAAKRFPRFSFPNGRLGPPMAGVA